MVLVVKRAKGRHRGLKRREEDENRHNVHSKRDQGSGKPRTQIIRKENQRPIKGVGRIVALFLGCIKHRTAQGGGEGTADEGV